MDRGGETQFPAAPLENYMSFSILWVDRGGETTALMRRLLWMECFSILWVDRGGETAPLRNAQNPWRKFQYPLGGSWG